MLIRILKSPITLFISIILGILLGVYAGWLNPILSIFNQIYSALLQVCVIPIVACAIILNIGKLFQKQFRGILFKWIVSIVITMTFAALLGILSITATRNFIAPDSQTKAMLSKMVESDNQTENTIDMFNELHLYKENKFEETQQFTITDFIFNSVPSNIFSALTENNIMQILVFSCIFGIMLAFVDKKRAEPLIMIATGFYKAFCKFVDYLLIVLPFAFCSMLAEQFSNEGMAISSVLGMLAKFIGINYVTAVIIILIAFAFIQIKTKCTLSDHLKAVKQVFFISIATSSCIASTPTLIEDIPEPLGLDKKLVGSIAPISVLLCQPGTIAGAALLAMYSTTIYDVNVDVNTIFIVLIGSIVFSISSTGVPGVLAVNMLNIVLQPIGVPSELMILIFLSSIMFFQGIIVFASLYSNVAVASFLLSSRKTKK